MGTALSSPAALRNRDPILAVLRRELPGSGLVLEIASGSGEHAVHFAAGLPAFTFQPSDPDPAARASILAYARGEALPNLLPPVALDASLPGTWPVERADAMLAINMAHISDWAATVGLFQGGSALLSPGAPLILYGPYLEADVEPAPSNLAFDRSLKERNPAWGLRELSDVDRLATTWGFQRTARHAMPANNLTLVYRRTQG
jgi:hypothetical protein